MYSRCNLFLDTGFANILSWSAASLFVLLTECLRRMRTPLLLGRVFSRCRFGLAGEASPSPPVSSLTFLRLFCRSPRGAAEKSTNTAVGRSTSPHASHHFSLLLLCSVTVWCTHCGLLCLHGGSTLLSVCSGHSLKSVLSEIQTATPALPCV